MEPNILISHQGCEFFLQKGNLYEKTTNRRVNEQNYLFARNYGTKPYDILAIETSVYFIYPNKAKKINNSRLFQDKFFDVFYTEGTGDEHGNDIYVFTLRNGSRKPSLLGRQLVEITENVYQIGKHAYQIKDNQLSYMCSCHKFELCGNLLEIYCGEPGFDKLFVFIRKSNGWEVKQEYLPGTYQTRKIDISF